MTYSFLNKNLITPLYYTLKRDSRLSLLKDYKRLQWLSTDEIKARQLEKFKLLFEFAYRECQFYNKIYREHGLRPEDIRSLDDIKSIPMIYKKDIQLYSESMIASNCDKAVIYMESSGGSTGVPTNFWADKRAIAKKTASSMMFDEWSGWNVGENVFYLWGADTDIKNNASIKEKIIQKYVFRNEIFNAFKITDLEMHRLAIKIIKQKPTLLIAYAGAAEAFSSFVLKNEINGVFVPGIICSAETLTEKARLNIQNALGGKVLNRYGSREVGLIAAECQAQEGLHINTENIYFEVDDSNPTFKKKGLGEIIVTDFNNYAMPIIRYNMGDVAEIQQKKCSCGRGMPIISGVKGRVSDFIKTSKGELIHGEFFTHLFYGINNIDRFQFIQRSIFDLEVNIVCSGSIDKLIINSIIDKIKNLMGHEMNIKINYVKGISCTSSGKFRFTISEI